MNENLKEVKVARQMTGGGAGSAEEMDVAKGWRQGASGKQEIRAQNS